MSMNVDSSSKFNFESDKPQKEKNQSTPNSLAQKILSENTPTHEGKKNFTSNTTVESTLPSLRDQANDVMSLKPAGTFLFRPSDTKPDIIIFVYKNPETGLLNQSKLYPEGNGKYKSDPDPQGHVSEWTVQSLIDNYGKENLVTTRNAWFPTITPQQAEIILGQKPNDSFLLRPSSKNISELVVTRKINNKIVHQRFTALGNGQYLTNEQNRVSEKQLIELLGSHNLVIPHTKWFPPISDIRAESILQDQPVGSYLIRLTDSDPITPQLTVKYEDMIRHLPLIPMGIGLYLFPDNQIYSEQQLIALMDKDLLITPKPFALTYDSLPVLNFEQTEENVRDLKNKECFFRKTSDEKSLVVAYKIKDNIVQRKYEASDEPGIFLEEDDKTHTKHKINLQQIARKLESQGFKIVALKGIKLPESSLFPSPKVAEEDASRQHPIPQTSSRTSKQSDFFTPKIEKMKSPGTHMALAFKTPISFKTNASNQIIDETITYPSYDPNKIVAGLITEAFDPGAAPSKKMHPQHLAWALNMAMCNLPKDENLDHVTREALQFAILNSWRKAAPVQDAGSQDAGIQQKSPFLQDNWEYYRSQSKVCQYVNAIYSEHLKMSIRMVDSSLIKEVFSREHPYPQPYEMTYDSLPLFGLDQTEEIAGKLKNKECLFRKGSDNKSLVVAYNHNGKITQMKFEASDEPGKFIEENPKTKTTHKIDLQHMAQQLESQGFEIVPSHRIELLANIPRTSSKIPEIQITDKASFERYLNVLFKNIKDAPPNVPIYMDISQVVEAAKIDQVPDYFQSLFREFNTLYRTQFTAALAKSKNDPDQYQRLKMLDQNSLVNLFAIFDYHGQTLITGSSPVIDAVDNISKTHGFCPNPEQALKGLIRLSGNSAQQVLETYDLVFPRQAPITQARLVTGKNRKYVEGTPHALNASKTAASSAHTSPIPSDEPIGIVCNSWAEFTSSQTFKEFEKLSTAKEAPPYLKIFPAATAALLEGFNNLKIDESFQAQGIQDILQMTYFLMRQAMGEAIFRKDDFPAFNACIELIHQLVQNLFVFVQPYDSHAFSAALKAEYIGGNDPLIPRSLSSGVSVSLKPSAMHCVSSILGAAENLKGSNNLNVVVLKDSYYETTGILDKAKSYQLSKLDGDAFSKNANAGLKNIHNAPIDLFLCEYHHNVSAKRHSYSQEKIMEQIIYLIESGKAAKPLTVAIDCTLSLQDSPDLQALFANQNIQAYIREGKLNTVLFRSAQKFDMLGMDNYYGGIVTTVNNGKVFDKFSARMNDPKDQLSGFHYQGLSHIHTHASPFLDIYREAIMTATQTLYNKLPPQSIWKPGSTNPIQISQIKDDKTFFIELKFNINSPLMKAIKTCLLRFAQENQLLVTERASFGFAAMNITEVANMGIMRLTPGLESVKDLDLYALFFKTLQEVINKHPGANDFAIADIIENLIIPTSPAAQIFHNLREDSLAPNPVMQISPTKLKDAACLDLAFSPEDLFDDGKLMEAVQSAFIRFQDKNKLDKFHVYSYDKFQADLPVLEKLKSQPVLRFNPSKENENNLALYTQFFEELEKIVWGNKKQGYMSPGEVLNKEIKNNDTYKRGWRTSPQNGSAKQHLNETTQKIISQINRLYPL